MFINLLPVSFVLFNIVYSDFAKNHFLKEFMKKYKGKQWERTESSFFEDLKRLRVANNKTQHTGQIDELKYVDGYWLFKYDFRIAGTNESPKSSGNRIVGYIDNAHNKIIILFLYAKTDLPKNQGETVFIVNTIKQNFPEIATKLSIK